jgi:hypothetical protein
MVAYALSTCVISSCCSVFSGVCASSRTNDCEQGCGGAGREGYLGRHDVLVALVRARRVGGVREEGGVV